MGPCVNNFIHNEMAQKILQISQRMFFFQFKREFKQHGYHMVRVSITNSITFQLEKRSFILYQH